MTAAIPQDILSEAVDIASDIPSRVKDLNREFAALVIARAILAERERCAMIAETLSTFIPGLPWHDENNIKCAEGMRIARAIRNPTGE